MRQEILKLAWVNPAFMAEPSNRADRRRAEKEGRVARPAADGDSTRPQYKTIIITAGVSTFLTSVVMGLLPYIYGLFTGDIKTQIVKEINQTITPITQAVAELKTQVAVLKNSVENLEKLGPVGRLKTQATKLGIKDPQINSVNLKPQTSVDPKKPLATFVATYTLNNDPSYYIHINYDIEGIEKDTLIVLVHGAVFDRGIRYSEIEPSRVNIPLSQKSFTFQWIGETPDGKKTPLPPVKFAILQRDESNNNLVLATGLASQPTT